MCWCDGASEVVVETVVQSACCFQLPPVHYSIKRASFLTKRASMGVTLLVPPPPSLPLDGEVAKGYVEIPQVEPAVVMQLCLQSAATWYAHPLWLPRFYSPTGQAASTLHVMVLLLVYQAKALKGSADPELMQDLHTVTDLALRATEVTACSVGETMSTLLVQEPDPGGYEGF